MEMPGVYFMAGNRPACPKCVEGMLIREEVTPSGVAEGQWFAAEAEMRCGWCDQPVAREACAPAFEGLMTVVESMMDTDEPPIGDSAAEAHEAVRRAKANVGAAYRELVKARNRVIALGGRLSDEPVSE